jgi:magnesium chelatase subunit D
MRDVLDLGDPFVRGLTCAALHPGLRSILVFDAARDQLDWAADLLAQMLRVVDGASVVERLRLGTTDTDDVLWGMPFPAFRSGGLGFVWRGLLTGGRTGSAQQVIIIPDLTRLGLAAQRAVVTTMGAEVVHLERHGQHASWQPRICWLAGCTTETIGQVSPHLLDRFALRLRMPTAVAHDSVIAAEELLRALGDERSRTGPVSVQLPAGVEEELQGAAQQ